jgi:hypothetical protein
MLGAFGYSQRLPDLPDWVWQRLEYHVRMYQDVAIVGLASDTPYGMGPSTCCPSFACTAVSPSAYCDDVRSIRTPSLPLPR